MPITERQEEESNWPYLMMAVCVLKLTPAALCSGESARSATLSTPPIVAVSSSSISLPRDFRGAMLGMTIEELRRVRHLRSEERLGVADTGGNEPAIKIPEQTEKNAVFLDADIADKKADSSLESVVYAMSNGRLSDIRLYYQSNKWSFETFKNEGAKRYGVPTKNTLIGVADGAAAQVQAVEWADHRTCIYRTCSRRSSVTDLTCFELIWDPRTSTTGCSSFADQQGTR